MRKIYALLVSALLFGTLSIQAQVATNGGSGLAANYADLASAIAGLNAATITDPVVITLTGNETAPAGTGYYITATGTASNTITIQGVGSTLTAGVNVAGGNMDAVFKIVGGDYITIRNFTIQENASNTVTTTGATNTMTEAGILIIHSSATDGAQFNTIENNTITLSSAYPNAVGILSTSASTTSNASPGANTATDATSTQGTNSNNKVYGNTISQCAYGIMFICPPVTATVFETGNDIGGTMVSTGNNITYGNNTASSGPWNRSSTASGGIVFRNGAGNSIRYNTVNTVPTLTIASTGIFISSGTAPVGVTYNSVISNNSVTMTNTGTTAITGIDFGHGTAGTATLTGNLNTVNITQSAGAANSAAIIAIRSNYVSNVNSITNNTVTVTQGTSAGSLTSAVTGITTAAAATGTGANNLVSGNTITLAQNAPTGTGTYGSGAITYIDVNSTSAAINVTNNTINTQGSTIRSTGTLIGVNQNSTTTGLVNIKSNNCNIDRIAASGAASFHTTSSTPSEVADTISNNNIIFTGLSGSSSITAISSGGGPSSPVVGNKSICNNIISIGGTHSGATVGILSSFTNTGKFNGNSITISCAATTVTGFTSTSTVATVDRNTFSLASSATTPTIIGITLTGTTGPHNVMNNSFTTLSASAASTSGPTITAIQVSAGTGGSNINNNTMAGASTGAGSGSATITGIVISGGTSPNVFKNKIYGLTTQCTGTSTLLAGIRVSAATTSANIYNNLIGFNDPLTGVNSVDAIRAINLTSTTTTSSLNVYYNTVYINSSSTGTNFGSTGIFHTVSTTSNTATLDLRNNIIVNTSTPSGTGLTVAYRRSAGTAGALANYASTSNNNLFYAGTPGASNLIYADGAGTAQSMSDYKNGAFTAGNIAPRDASSVTENPPFLSTTGSSNDFLHINTTVATQAESGASPIAGYTDDYDGNLRNASTPDIGADEFNGILADLTGPNITYTPLVNTTCNLQRDLTAIITDPSGVNTAPGTKPRLYYKRSTTNNDFVGNTIADNGWKYVEATNSTSPFNFTMNYSIMFGGAPSVGETIQYFVVAQDLVGTPNVGINSGVFASTPANVMLTSPAFPVTGANSYTILNGVGADVTIGAAGDYTNFTGASGLFAALNASGLTNNISATIMDASITEPGTVALNQLTYGCAGLYTLTIKPDVGVDAVLTGSVAAGAIIKLNGADNVIIDGSNNGTNSRNLTIRNTTTTASGNAALWLAAPAAGNGATNNVVKNTIIEGNSATTTFLGMYVGGNTTISLTAAGNENNNNNLITNNLFRKTQNGLALFGYGANTPDVGNVISNNNFGTAIAGEGFSLIGINTDRQQNLVVSGNEVQNLVNTGASFSGNMFGIRLLDFKNGTCFRNSIHDISTTSTSTPKLYGIGVTSSTYTTAGNPSQGLVHNNLVYKINSTGTSAVWNTTGILASAGYGDKFYYNSVYLTGQLANSSSGFVAAFANGDGNITSVGTNIDVRNNIFSLTGSSATSGGNFWAYYTAATTLSGSTLNNNDLYSAGTGATNNVGRFNGVNYATLPAWQAASGQDANSASADPMFVSTTDLHINSGLTPTPLESGGTVLSVTTDFDGTTRPAAGVNGGGIAPDMGAYEFDGVPLSPCTTPSGQPTGFNLVATGQTSATGSFTAASPAPSNYLVVRTTSPSLAGSPVDGTNYNTGSNTYFGTGGFVVANGSSTNFSATGLTSGTTYYFWIFSFNTGNCQGGPKYLASTPLVGTVTTGALFTSITTGNWEDGSTWNQSGAVPSLSDDVAIANTHIVTVNTTAANAGSVAINSGGTLSVVGNTLTLAGAAGSGLTNASGGTLNISGGTLNLGPTDNSFANRLLTNSGTLSVNSGTLFIAGRLLVNTGATLNQTGGNIVVDGNAGGVAANSVGSGVAIVDLNPSTLASINLTGGTFTIVDPHANTTASKVLLVTGSTNGNLNVASNHTFRFGNGVSTDAGGNAANGFRIDTWATTTGMPLGNVIIEGPTGTNRIVSGQYQQPVLGNVTVNNGGESRIATIYINGNLTVNSGGIFTTTSGLSMTNSGFVDGSSVTFSASPNTQTISGPGTFRNAASSPTANFVALVVNNSDASGVTFGTGITNPTFSGAITVTNGRLNATGITLQGTAAQPIALTAATSLINVADFTLNNTTGSTLSGSGFLNVTGTATVTSGALASAGRMVLKSTASGTARVAPLTGTITGNVIVERYIPANGKRAWRLLGANVTSASAPTINAAWQEGGAASSMGTHITQLGGTGGNGFDASTIALNNHSIYSWNSAALTPLTNTDVNKVTDNGGAYFLFVRGDRNIDLNNASSSSNTTLRATGVINQGAVTAGVAGASFSLIPNPYPSPVDYEAIVAANAGLSGTYYIWDATLGSVGAYRTIMRTGANTYSSTPTTGSDNTMRYLRSGQAFFIPDNMQVSFTEAMKTDMLPAVNVYRPGTGTEEMTIDLKVVDANGTAVLYDGVREKYNNSYAAAVDVNDAPKLNNFNENLAIVRDNKALSIEQRPLIDAADTIFLKLWNTGVKNYQFDINPANFSTSANLSAYLMDSYLQTTTPVSLSGNSFHNFSITTDAGSAAPDRFMIVFRAATPLPANFTNVKAYQKNSGIQVEWNVGSEVDVVKYEVEKSTNGTSFDKAAAVTATNSKAYSWFDASPNNGVNFYRIKVINKDNTYSYSNVVNVKLGDTKGDITVYPNPVKGNLINVQFTNLEKGIYTVQLINSLGQQVYSTKIAHSGGSASQALQLNASLSKGVYQLMVINGENKITQQVIAE